MTSGSDAITLANLNIRDPDGNNLGNWLEGPDETMNPIKRIVDLVHSMENQGYSMDYIMMQLHHGFNCSAMECSTERLSDIACDFWGLAEEIKRNAESAHAMTCWGN